MPTEILKIEGHLIDHSTQTGIAGLRVEAWDTDQFFNAAVAGAETDAKGAFQIEFDESYFLALFDDRQPTLFFKVFHQGRLVHSTEDSVLWDAQNDPADVVIETDFQLDEPAPSQRREVKGKVIFADGYAASGLLVTAFDQDLRAEQELGKSRTNEYGLYQIFYYPAAFQDSETGGADLIVKAIASDGSLLAASAVLFNAPPVAELDLTISAEVQPPPPLFEKISLALQPLLGDVQAPDLQEAAEIADGEHRDLSFLAGETGFEKSVLARYALAYKLAQENLPPQFWFALLGGSPFQFAETGSLGEQLKGVTDTLFSLDEITVRRSFARAFNQNEISKDFQSATDGWLDAFRQFISGRAVNDSTQDLFLKSSLESAGIGDISKQERFARLYNEYQGFTPELLVALESDESFKAGEVADLHTSFRLAEMTQGDFSVVDAIKKVFEVTQPEKIRTLARRSELEWVDLITSKYTEGAISIPMDVDEVGGIPKPPTVEIYGKYLARQFHEAFPTTAFAGGLDRALQNGGAHGLEHGESLASFLERYEDFDFLRSPVDDFFLNHTDPDFEEIVGNQDFVQEVKAVQRVFKLAPTFEATDALLADGLHSAQQIYRMGESQFVHRYSNAGNTGEESQSAASLDAASARAIWNRAADTYSAALSIVADLKALDPNSLPLALQNDGQALSTFPNWENLFQTGDLCDCEHCRSVLSPAAYFADLLMFLKDRKAADTNFTVKDILFRRRADLGYLELNCENALTTLPYIDVVCEVLEAAIAKDENDVELIGLTKILDTSAATITLVTNALHTANLNFGTQFSLSKVDPVDPTRWVVHGDERTFLLKKKTTPNFFAEVLRNTKASAAELRAYPQYVNPKAYDKLRQAKYPLALPFDLFAEEVRSSMQKTNLQRWDLMTTFRGSLIPNNPTDGDIAAEYFGISVGGAAFRFNGVLTAGQKFILIHDPSLAAVSGIASYQQAIDELTRGTGYSPVEGLPAGFTFPAVITGPPNNIPIKYEPFTFDEKGLILIADTTEAGQKTVWGETGNNDWLDTTGDVLSSLCIVKNFLRKTGLEYNELLALLDLDFINPAGDITVTHLVASCDTVRKVIVGLNPTKLDRIHRFLRMWRKLKGWKIWEVDLVIRHPRIGNGALDEPFLIKLFYFEQLRNRLGGKTTVEQVCALFGNLNIETHFTKLHEKREDALYQQLFLNRRLINPIDTAFELDPITGDLPAGQTITAHRSVVQAALGIREADLVVLQGLTAPNGSSYINDNLTLSNLSFLWRHSWLLKLLKFKPEEWKLVLKLVQENVPNFSDPESAWKYVNRADQIKQAGFTPDEINWLLAADLTAKAAVKIPDTTRFLSSLRGALQKIHEENDPAQYGFLTVDPPTDEGQLGALLTTLLQKLNRTDAEIDFFLRTLRGRVILETSVPGLPTGFNFPIDITGLPNYIPIEYDATDHLFRFTGMMTDAQRLLLLNESSSALIALRASGQLAAPALGLPAGFFFPAVITGPPNNIPIEYDEPNLLFRFTGLMTDAQRTILLDESSPAMIALRETGQLEAPVQGMPPGFVFPPEITDVVNIEYDEPHSLLRLTGLMTDAQRTILRTDASLASVLGIPDFLPAIEDLYQQSLTVVNSYRTGIGDLYQQSFAAVTSYQTGIADLYQQSVAAPTIYANTEIEATLTGGLILPTHLPSLPIRYDPPPNPPPPPPGRLSFTGVMTFEEQTALLDAGNSIDDILELIERPLMAIKFFEPVFTAPLAQLPAAVDFKTQLPADLAAKISYDAEQRLLRFAGIMTTAEYAVLRDVVPTDFPENAYHFALGSLKAQPASILPSDERVWLTEIDLDVTLPANNTLAKRYATAATRALSYLSRTLAIDAVIQMSSAQLGLTEAMTRRLLTSYAILPDPPNPNVTLMKYLTEGFAFTTPPVNYSNALFANAFQGWFWATRVATIWKKLKVTLPEVERLAVLTTGSQLLELLSLPLTSSSPIASIDRFLRTVRLLRVRDSLPETEITFLEVLEKLAAGSTRVAFAADVENLNEAWLSADTLALVDGINLAYPADYLLAESWERLRRAFDVLANLSAGPDVVKAFAAASMTEGHARTLKGLLRSKFGSETWLTISVEIQDVLRERKRDALAAYLLTQQPSGAPSGKWENTNDLYAYYLLDIEMSSCQLTSRLVQASGSVQLFVQRCFMGLEPDVEVNADGANGDSAWRWWKWMSKYRVWEANLTVFLWPEEVIAPELKSDRSQFFKDLENELIQNEINQPNVEAAFSNYLEKLDGVAQLEVAGFFQEEDGGDSVVHVFGRTKGADPHLYYYRRYDYRQWTPWEKVDLDIQGDYLIPAVVNNQLFLFWPVFSEVPNEAANSTVQIPSADQTVALKRPWKNLRLQMAVSTYRQGKWTAKRVSTDSVLSSIFDSEIVKKHYHFRPIDRSNVDGRFGIKFDGYSFVTPPPIIQNTRGEAGTTLPTGAVISGAFEIAGCKGVPELADFPGYFTHFLRPERESAGDDTSFMRWLELAARLDHDNDFTLTRYTFDQPGIGGTVTPPPVSANKVVLRQTPGFFKMTPSWHLSYFDKLLLDRFVFFGLDNSPGDLLPLGAGLPFFYNDTHRTFFVLPIGSLYMPEQKAMVRHWEDFFEGQVQSWLDSFDLAAVSAEQRAQMEKFLQVRLREEKNPPYSDAQLKNLMGQYSIKAFQGYLGVFQSFYLLRQFDFKNFYHPFVCDFGKLVYNPLQGVPGLMKRETQLKDSGFSFVQTYVPTGAVQSPPIGSYPKEVVDFTPDGAYSSYNWELFFHAPLLIANALSQNQRFEEARDWYHFIFNPIGVESSAPGGSSMSKFWITKPFFETTSAQYIQQRIETLLRMLAGDTSLPGYSVQARKDLEGQVKDWRDHPFDPHRIANYRTVAYQKTTVMRYLDNLIAWGDYLFQQDSMESINEATQLYVLAAELLGPPPKNVPPQARPPVESFNELEKEFDKFSNALVQVENLVPLMPGNGNAGASAPLPMLYFCIPHSEKMLAYWGTIADRLYKIRHCMNIEGVVRQLALFEPPIDPAALVKAVAGGVDIGAALADLNAPMPLYRFNVLLQKANEVCNDVKALGGALLAALEKIDAEAMALLRQGQEIRVLEAVTGVRELQIKEAKENLEGAKRSKVTVETRRNYYRDIARLSTQEKLHLAKLTESHVKQEIAQGVKLVASVLSYLPDIDLGASGFGGSPIAKFKIGGLNLGQASGIAGDVIALLGQIAANDAIMASSKATFDRRWEDWKLQERTADKELLQMDKQIAAAELRVAIAEKELANHIQQIENAKAIDAFMRSKYTNLELYQWQVGQISGVYFQSYKLAYELAKKAERCFRFELGVQDSSYIKFGYWDSLKKGLLSGEKLQYDLRRLETAYLDQNRREHELTKHISLALLDPLALIKLRETGRCFFQLPEEIFDLDYPGHYFRRIKSVSLTLPCVTGPYTTISCTLRLLTNEIRINTDTQTDYPHNTEGDLPADDTRFIQNNIPVKAIAASSAQNDSGLFELNFRDERFLPFEGAGAISGWSLELFTDNPANNPEPSTPDFGQPLRQFDYGTISDAIVHVKYTAREDAGPFKNKAIAHLRDYFNTTEATPTPSLRMLDLRREFPGQWHRFLTPVSPGGANILEFEMSPGLFQIKDLDKTLKINGIWLLSRCTNPGTYGVVLTPLLPADSNSFSLVRANQYGGLHFAAKDVSAASGVKVEPTQPPVLWKLEMTRPGGGSLMVDPVTGVPEVEDLILVLGYEWD